MRTSQVNIDSPCHESWEAMDGDEERRFCGVCQKHVHNLSAMRHDEAKALLRETAGEHLCVRYTSESDGTLRFRDLVPRGMLTRKLLRTAFAATMLAACAPHGDDAPRNLGEAIIESQQANTVPTPDGGCNYTTGPFTTFHLPAGHPLCSNPGPTEAPTIVTVPSELPQVPEVPPMIEMGAIAPMEPPPPPVVDPIVRPKMGEAIAMPETNEPFVPCDPLPGYAPPPPPQPPTEEPPMVRMGDFAGPPEPPPPPKVEEARPPGRKTMGTMSPRRPDVEETMGKLEMPVD
jgi:hypothetical protein